MGDLLDVVHRREELPLRVDLSSPAKGVKRRIAMWHATQRRLNMDGAFLVAALAREKSNAGA